MLAGLAPTVCIVFIFLHAFSAIALRFTATVYWVDPDFCAMNGVKGLMVVPAVDVLPVTVLCKIGFVLIGVMTSFDCDVSVP